MSSAPGAAARVARWFGADDPWRRPRPPIGRADVVLVLCLEALGLLSLELVRSVGVLTDVAAPWGVQWLAVGTGPVLLLGRRRWPLAVAALAALHMVLVGVTMPVVMGQVTLQVVYFVAILSGVAWARDRRWMLVVVGGIVVVMFAWIALQFAVGSGVQEILDQVGGGERTGLLAPVTAGIALTVVVNVVYFGGAVVGGQLLWRSARDRALLEEQAGTIAAQHDELRARAVTEERLRIARELHDVVAHHVSVIGIQAAAARRVMERDPAAAATALGRIEASSRDGVTSMRGLLGTLRDVERPPGHPERPDAPTDAPDRTPQPGLGELPTLVAACTTAGRRCTYDLVESPEGAAARLPASVAHSLHRTVQEALTNIERHSTASRVSVVVRVLEGPAGHAEAEVVDDGRPRQGTSGGGLGQLGIRERAASHRGSVDIGPRPTGGYRVRVRYPWSTVASPDGALESDGVLR